MGQKNLKGSVSIDKDGNRIRLRWRYQSKRYSLNLFSYTKANLLQAKKVAVIIENDLVADTFDFTLNKYKRDYPCVSSEKKSLVQHFEHWVKLYR